MSVISGAALLKRLDRNLPPDRRLVVAPMLEPGKQITSTQASIDLRLGCNFRLAVASTMGVLDEFSEGPQDSFSDLAHVYDRFHVPLGASVTVHPHQLLLAQTLEYLRFPDDLMAYVVGRSTLGRLGLIIATAIGIHPRFFGPLTLEIRNLGEVPLRLYPGQAVAQLFFHEVAAPEAIDNTGADAEDAPEPQYSGSVDPLPRRISDDKTAARLQALRRQQLDAAAVLRKGPKVKKAEADAEGGSSPGGDQNIPAL